MVRRWGNGSMKILPFSTENYDYEDYDPSKVNITHEGLQRLKVAYNLVRIRRVIIAHEKTTVIDGPPEPEVWTPSSPRPDIRKKIEEMKEWDLGWLKYVAIAVGVIALGIFLIATLPMVLMVGAVVAGVALDPCILCELEDGTWAEVYYYF